GSHPPLRKTILARRHANVVARMQTAADRATFALALSAGILDSGIAGANGPTTLPVCPTRVAAGAGGPVCGSAAFRPACCRVTSLLHGQCGRLAAGSPASSDRRSRPLRRV